MASEQQSSPSRKQKFLSWFSSVKRNLPPALVAAESNQIFYPATTVVTRLINSPGKVTNWEQFNKAVFFDLQKQADPSKANALTKLGSLNKGFMTSLVNSGTTRTFRFMTQDSFQKSTENAIAPYVKDLMDDKKRQTLAGGVSGVATGLTERLLFHPLDTRKILKQMDSKALSGLYNGMGVGLFRDGLSAGLFFGSYYGAYNFLKDVKYPFLSLDKNAKDNLDKLGGATIAGAVTAVGTNPANVIKTRMQSKGGSSSASILSTMKESLKSEGLKSVVNGNLFKDVGKVMHESGGKGFIATGLEICSKEGVSALMKGVKPNLALAPLRSTIPFYAFLFAKKKWDDYQQQPPKEPEKKPWVKP